MAANQIKDEEDEKEQQDHLEFMYDIDEEIPVHKESNAPPPIINVRTRKMRKEDSRKEEQDKNFTTYTRRTKRAPNTQLQEDQPESNAPTPMDIESSAHSQPGPEAEKQVESNNRQEK